MRIILSVIFLLIANSIYAQENVNLKFVRPSKLQGSVTKIKIAINNSELLLKNGSEISINETIDFSTSLRIDASVMLGSKTSYYLNAKPSENYVFEVGFNFNRIYIKLLEGEEAEQNDTSLDYQEKMDVDINKLQKENDDFAIGIKTEQIDPSEAIRQEWLSRGGKIRYESYMITGTYFNVNVEGMGDLNGYGGGVSVTQSWINLEIPQFKAGISTWNSYNIGWGYDLLIYGMSYKMKIDPITSNVEVMTMTMPINLNLGWTFGFGKFKDNSSWNGLALTIKYKPSVMLNLTTTTVEMTSSDPMIPSTTTALSDSNTQFNPGGFGFDIDFSSFSAKMNKLAPKPKSKFSFFLLPPLGDNPLFISLSYGLSVYSR